MILILQWDPPSISPVIQLIQTQTRLLTTPLATAKLPVSDEMRHPQAHPTTGTTWGRARGERFNQLPEH